jgi:hypothetical protein
MARQRASVSKSDWADAAVFLKRIGSLPVAIELTPGRVRIDLGSGDGFSLPYDVQETERLKLGSLLRIPLGNMGNDVRSLRLHRAQQPTRLGDDCAAEHFPIQRTRRPQAIAGQSG